MLFNNKNKKEVELLAREIGSDLEKGQFRKLYNRILNKKYNDAIKTYLFKIIVNSISKIFSDIYLL